MRFKKKSILHLSVQLIVVAIVVFPSSSSIAITKLHNATTYQHLRLSATMWPLVKDQELSKINTGIKEAIILDMLASHLEFTYEICPPLDILSPGFILPNGSWSGSAGQLERGEVDMCINTIALDSPKRQVMDISYPILFVDTAILIPFPREESKWIDATFKSQVWMVFGLSAFFTVISAWIINRITESRRNETRRTLSYWIFHFISAWTNHSQGISLRNPSTSLRLVFICSITSVYVLTNYFTATFTSVLSIPILKASVNSIEDVANSSTVKALLFKGTNTDTYIMTSMNDPILTKIGDQMRRHPERRILNVFSVNDISTVVKEDFALPLIKSNAESLIETSYQLNKKCLVTMAEKTFLPRAQGFSFPKNSPLVSVIDYHILLLHQAGLIRYAEKRSSSNRNPCSLSEVKRTYSNKSVVALKLRDFFGFFVIFCAGTGLGFVCYLAELAAAVIMKTKAKAKINNCKQTN